jgi:hypothetical protein
VSRIHSHTLLDERKLVMNYKVNANFVSELICWLLMPKDCGIE